MYPLSSGWERPFSKKCQIGRKLKSKTPQKRKKKIKNQSILRFFSKIYLLIRLLKEYWFNSRKNCCLIFDEFSVNWSFWIVVYRTNPAKRPWCYGSISRLQLTCIFLSFPKLSIKSQIISIYTTTHSEQNYSTLALSKEVSERSFWFWVWFCLGCSVEPWNRDFLFDIFCQFLIYSTLTVRLPKMPNLRLSLYSSPHKRFSMWLR